MVWVRWAVGHLVLSMPHFQRSSTLFLYAVSFPPSRRARAMAEAFEFPDHYHPIRRPLLARMEHRSAMKALPCRPSALQPSPDSGIENVTESLGLYCRPRRSAI